jgi:hypothetical protein
MVVSRQDSTADQPQNWYSQVGAMQTQLQSECVMLLAAPTLSCTSFVTNESTFRLSGLRRMGFSFGVGGRRLHARGGVMIGC